VPFGPRPGRNVKLKATVAYNGSGFHGFAPNPDVLTVTGAIEKALQTILGEPVTITGAGRTDKGVHSRGQVISFESPEMIRQNKVDPVKLERSINGLCGPDIIVRDIVRVPDDFHARFSAKWRRYRYQVLTSREPDPLRSHFAWHVWEPLNLDAMRRAAALFVGEHDFSSFCRRPKVGEDAHEKLMDRTVLATEWVEAGDDMLEFWIEATAFCHQMVRSIVGTIIDVGIGDIAPDDIPAIIDAKNRKLAGQVAPPHGLTFWEVHYPADVLS
jgi:tRNA pseudouridine38-40 synthase